MHTNRRDSRRIILCCWGQVLSTLAKGGKQTHFINKKRSD